ncbi:MAG TPA: gliding motility-associated C-terminal domain-containing protein [Flavobacteriales bacterium]
MPHFRMTAAAIPGVLRALVAALALVLSLALQAQGVKYWTGGAGAWADAAHWSLSPNGPGGAGVPQAQDQVWIVAQEEPVSIALSGQQACAGLAVEGRNALVTLTGTTGSLRIGGDWSLKGSVQWGYSGEVRLNTRDIATLELRGIPVAGGLVIEGGTWVQRNDVVLERSLEVRAGTWTSEGGLLKAEGLRFGNGRGKRFMAGPSVLMLGQLPQGPQAAASIDAGTSRLLVDGAVSEWGPWAEAQAARGINICGTGPGQTLFTINAQLVSNYNGFGVSCHGVCNGQVQVTVTGGSGNFTYQWVGGPASSTWNNVCPGNQIVIVTDQTQHIGCATTVQVTDPALLNVIFFGGVPPSCAGVCDGRLNAFAVGGVPLYTYNWNNGAGTGDSFTQLCPGVNTLRVTDANGCTFDTTFTFTLQPILPNLTVTNVSCFGQCDGAAQVAATGGAGGFTYDWEPGAPAGDGTNAVTDLCPGNYTVRIADVNGCDTLVAFTLTQPSAIVPNPTQTPASCASACDGTASVAPPGGPYFFDWGPDPVAGDGTPNATGLCAGVYTCLITDQATGCDTLVGFTITAPSSILPNETFTDATCAGTCNGGIITNPSGGAGVGYSFVWVPSVSSTATASNLCAGDYSVTITDANACDTTITVTIAEPPPLGADTTHTDISCAGLCDGSATATAFGGSPGYTYAWSPAPGSGQGTDTAGNLCAGTWNVTITDVAGCDTTITFVIVEPLPLSVSLVLTPATCSPGCDGTATASVTGGTPFYAYLWTPAPSTGQGTAVASGFCAGDHQLTVTDRNGCDTTILFTITEPAPLVVAATVDDATCLSTCDGSIDLVVSGGVPNYIYSWTPDPGPGQGTASVSGLCPGDWTVTITDQANCDTTLTWTIGAPPPIEPNGTFTDETCAGPCDGTATVAPTGGSGTYSYDWEPGTPTGEGTPSVSGLCPGDWSVTISDGTCDTTWTFTILPIVPIDASLVQQDVLCAGDCTGEATVTATGGNGTLAYDWQPGTPAGEGTATATGLCPGPWSVTVSDGTGCDTTITFTIQAPTPIVPNLIVQGENCIAPCTGHASVAPTGGTGAYTFDWGPDPIAGDGTDSVTALCAGTNYQVTITDGNGCDTTLFFTVDPFVPLVVTPTLTPVSCIGTCDGAVDVMVTGGEGPYTYSWTPNVTGQGTPNASGLCAGDYDLNIRDNNGCDTTITFTITAPDPFAVDATITPLTCATTRDGAIVINVTGGNGGYTYDWAPGTPTGEGTASVSALCAGDWSVTISDPNGCDTTITWTLTAPPALVGSVDVTPSHCGVCDGTIQVHASGGAGPYTFQWGPPINVTTTDSLQTGLCAGFYSVLVVDDSGCSLPLSTAITDSDAEALTITDGNISCSGACDGQVEVAFTCSFPTCTIAWFDAAGVPLGVNTNVMADLCPGDYIVRVINGDGCISIDTATVGPVIPITASFTTTPVICAGVCAGAAQLALVAPVGSTITWNPPPATGQGTTSVTGLCAFEYTVAIGNTGGCDTVLTVTIPGPQPITVDAVVTDETCAGLCNGAIDLTLSGGTGALSVVWSPIQPGSTSIGNLCPGDYTATITDASGCDTTITWTVDGPLPLTLGTSTTQSHCSLCDGTASVIAGGGTGLIGLVWTDATNTTIGTGMTVTDLCAGTYTVTATDQNGCELQANVQVTDANGEVLTTTDGQVLCATACDGQVSVSFTCSAPNCSTTWFDAANTIVAQGTNTVSGLCSGLYTVVVTNGNGCQSVDTAYVIPVQPILIDIASTPVTCFGTCDGTADLTITGGTPDYTATWTPAPATGQGTASVTGLCVGDYQVAITDAVGCDTTITVTIIGAPPITVAPVITDVSCNGLCDGAISLSTSGGQGGYTYDWSGTPVGDGTSSISQLCAGPWSVTITDVSGCDTTIVFNVSEPAVLTSTSVSTDSHCAVCDGTASALPSGGTAPYTYVWTLGGSPMGTDSTLTDLCAGIYLLEVTDANGCTVQTAVAISDADGEVTSTTGSTVTCPTDCNGTAEVDFVCSFPNCTIAWFDALGLPLGQSGSPATGLCPGLYLVEVTNGSGCITVDTAIVAAPLPILANATITQPICAGSCDGEVVLAPTGGAGGFDYDWNPEPGSGGDGTPQAGDLCAGVIEVTITDQTGCAITEQFNLIEPAAVSAIAVVDPISCAGGCDASITVMPEGGTGAGTYTFDWSPGNPVGDGTATVTGLCADTWSVLITDASGCDTLFSVTITDPVLLDVVLSTTDNGCFGDCAGTAQVTITGGAPDPAITWTDEAGLVIAQDVTSVTDLCAGDYEVLVEDANGCARTLAFTIDEGEPLIVDLTVLGESCNGPCDGTATAVTTGGSGTYTYDWEPGTPTGDGTASVSGLCAGEYTVLVTDAAGCDTLVGFTILPFAPIDAGATQTEVSCNGACDGTIVLAPTGGVGTLSYVWTPEPGTGQGTASVGQLCADDWSVTITDQAGCTATFDFTITEPAAITITVDEVIDASCSTAADGSIAVTLSGGAPVLGVAWVGPNGFSSTDEDISGLAPGVYVITVTDANDCQVQQQITVGAASGVIADAGADQQACPGAAITLDGGASQGGTDFSWSDEQGTVLGTEVMLEVNGLASGLHNIVLTVSDGICTDTDTVLVTILPDPAANAGADASIFQGDQVALGGQPSGSPGSSFIWQPDSVLNDGTAPNPTATLFQTTLFTLTVTSADGCIGTDQVLITVEPEFVIPTGFTPNGDGWNDAWQIDLIELFPNCEVEIFNRWGEPLFKSVGYKVPWDGRYSGGYVPVGTYYYTIVLNDPRFPEAFTGPLTVIR